MSDIVITAENLGKKYIIGHQAESGRYVAMRDVVMQSARGLWHKTMDLMQGKPIIPGDTMEEVWALKDVNFEIKRGEAVGIIGRNGAGKSTLLKVLSRITEPSAGRVTIKGRVASLLEVGTGFHPELTGRENIFLNGAILGMTRAEIRRKFDEIVAFAEVERFLDTPVKRYSSGMYVRLAFAVAAHLEPEILIVDEVLAVGDAEFQKKCMGKMGEVTKGGRTVLFVSHNMSAVEALCRRGILLRAGGLILDSGAEQAIQCYLDRSYSIIGGMPLGERKDRSGTGRARSIGFRILGDSGSEASSLQSGRSYTFEIEYQNDSGAAISNVVCSIDFYDERNVRLMMLRTSFSNVTLTLKEGRGRFSCSVDDLPIANGSYRLALFLSHAEREILDYIEDAASLLVDGGDFFGTGSQGMPTHCRILTRSAWSNE